MHIFFHGNTDRSTKNLIWLRTISFSIRIPSETVTYPCLAVRHYRMEVSFHQVHIIFINLYNHRKRG